MTPSDKNKNHFFFGLKGGDIKDIITILSQHPEVEEAYIFGSRAKNIYKNGSDVDIAVKGDALNFNIVRHISYLLNEETQMPNFFDVLNYHTINNKDLLDHIDRVGRLLYSKISSSKFI